MRQVPLAVRLKAGIQIVEVEFDVAVIDHLVRRVGSKGRELANGPGDSGAGTGDMWVGNPSWCGQDERRTGGGQRSQGDEAERTVLGNVERGNRPGVLAEGRRDHEGKD